MRFAAGRAGLLCVFALGLTLSGCVQMDPVDLALNQMLERQLDDGYFRYEFDFVKGRWSDKNNLVRQAGSAYALAEYLQHHDDQRVRTALAKAIRAFAADSVPWGDGLLLTEHSSTREAKAGATALASIAGLWYRQVSGDPSFDNALHAWRSGLLSLRNPDGLFFSRPGSTKESPYSNGEAWLALAVHSAVFPQDLEVRGALAAVDEAVLERYGKNADIGFFHWGLMAAAARYQATSDPRLVEFTLAQLRAYLGELRPHLNPNSNSCYAVEGMAAAMQVLRASNQEEQIRQLLLIRIEAEMEKNAALQIPLGAREIALGDKRELHSPDLRLFAGAFLNGRARPQTRIDATQHCLSAMLKQRALNRY